MIIGIDEVGRGCIAGDLIVVAYAFDEGATASEEAKLLCQDSKAFKSRKKREEAFDKIKPAGIYHIARRSIADIEKLNIRGATLDAMREAAHSVAQKTAESNENIKCLFDGRDIPDGMMFYSESVIKGDSKIAEIGAASIIAKVLRDKEMIEAAALYPGYGFENNAGYGTKAHCEAIAEKGLCPIHRSWAKKFLK